MKRGTAAPPARMLRSELRSASLRPPAARNRSFQMVGMPRATLGRSSMIIASSGSPWRNIWGMMSSEPAIRQV